MGVYHKNAVMTLVERLSKVIITLKPEGRTASAIKTVINKWFHKVSRTLFKSITFDYGKEFLNWWSMRNQNDVDVYFADPVTPFQRGLNEHSNGLLRRVGLLNLLTLTRWIRWMQLSQFPDETTVFESLLTTEHRWRYF